VAYEVAFDDQADRQRRELPRAARAELADALEALAEDPYSGPRYDPRLPPDFRTASFGSWGLLVYIIREKQQRIVVLDIAWIA
jgi:plasmid stabilization system protein ParE